MDSFVCALNLILWNTRQITTILLCSTICPPIGTCQHYNSCLSYHQDRPHDQWNIDPSNVFHSKDQVLSFLCSQSSRYLKIIIENVLIQVTWHHQMVWVPKGLHITRSFYHCLRFASCCDKLPWQKQLKGEMIYLAHSSRFKSITERKSMCQVTWNV